MLMVFTVPWTPPSPLTAPGGLSYPKPCAIASALSAGTRLKAEMMADQIELTPQADADVRIERRGKRMVIVGGPAFDAAAAIKADREERDETISGQSRRG